MKEEQENPFIKDFEENSGKDNKDSGLDFGELGLFKAITDSITSVSRSTETIKAKRDRNRLIFLILWTIIWMIFSIIMIKVLHLNPWCLIANIVIWIFGWGMSETLADHKEDRND